MPVEVIGFEDLADVGDRFQVVTDTAKAKQIVIYRESKARDVAMAKGARTATLDSLTQQFKEGDLKDLNVGHQGRRRWYGGSALRYIAGT